MAMVGLFWVTPDAVYVGSPPSALGSFVRLTSDGLEAEGPDGRRTWSWEGLRSAAVEDVPAASASGRASKFVGSVVSAAIGAFTGERPPEMTLRLQTEDAHEEVTVYAAASGGYGPEETALSQQLLARFVAGTADPRTIEAWGREHGLETTPKERVRESLLRAWLEA
ncbi:hypothetical protein [Streptomyces sp. NPDC088762]|uniref:hypothetical protein n=1 Tax=Streptomyces sp. NPDC088762 TaxID=3365891 RepID=UPI00382ACAD3